MLNLGDTIFVNSSGKTTARDVFIIIDGLAAIGFATASVINATK
jgi:hypothetical protein